MKLLKTLIAGILLITVVNDSFAAQSTYYVGSDASASAYLGADEPTEGNYYQGQPAPNAFRYYDSDFIGASSFITLEEFVGIDANDYNVTTATVTTVYDSDGVKITKTNADTMGEYLVYGMQAPRTCVVEGTVDGKAFKAIFEAYTGASDNKAAIGIRQDRGIGVESNSAVGNGGVITFEFKGFDDTVESPDDADAVTVGNETKSALGVVFKGFTQLGIHSKTGGKITVNGGAQIDVSSNDYGNIVDLTQYDGGAQDTSTTLTIARAVTGTLFPNQLTLVFEDDINTPAIGVEFEQSETVVEWTVEEEINVKGYELVRKGTSEVIAFVEYDAANDGSYVLDLVDYNGLVDLVVVDKDGSKSNPYSPDNGNEVTGNYSLVKGWNLISVPGDNADLSAVEAAALGSMWGWDGIQYVETDGQTAYEGIWVYADKEQVVTATATKSDADLTLQSGWTLAGPANTVTVPDNVMVFEWNGYYTPTASLDNGKGYWFFVTEQTDVTLDSE